MQDLIGLFVDYIKARRRWHLALLLLVPVLFGFLRQYDETLTFRTTLNDARFIVPASVVVLMTLVLHIVITYRIRFRLSLFWIRRQFARRGEVEWIAVSDSIAWHPLRWLDPSGKAIERPLAQEMAVILAEYPFRVVVVPQSLIDAAKHAEDYYADACVVTGHIEGQTLELKAQMILSKQRIDRLFSQLRSDRFDLDLDELVLPVKYFVEDPFLGSHFCVSVALGRSNTQHQATLARLVLRQAAGTALFYKDDESAREVFASVVDALRLEELPEVESDEIGQILFQVGYYLATHEDDADRAMSALKSAARYMPANPDLRRAIAILAIATDDSDGVDAQLAAIPDDPLAGLIRAANHYHHDRIEQAIDEYETIDRSHLSTTVSDDDVEYFYALVLIRTALTYGMSERPEAERAARIIQLTEEAIQIRPNMFAAYVVQGFGWALRQHEANSEARFETARALARDESGLRMCEYWEARARDILGGHQEAANRIKTLLGDDWLESDDADTLARLAQILNRTDGGAVEASLAASRAVELEPEHARAHHQRGVALFKQVLGEQDVNSTDAVALRTQARDAFFNVMRLADDRDDKVSASIFLGHLYVWDEDLVNAARYFRESLDIDPSSGSWTGLAEALIASGDIDGALQSLAAARPYHENDPDLDLLEGVAWQKKDDLAKAKQAYERALVSDKDHPAANINLAFLLFEEGDNEGALAYFDHAGAKGGDSADCLAGRAIALAGMGRTDEAAGSFERALAKDPKIRDLDVLRDEYMWSEKARATLAPIIGP